MEEINNLIIIENKWYGFLDIANIVKFIVNHFGDATLAEHTDIMKLLEETENFKDLQVTDLMSMSLSVFLLCFTFKKVCIADLFNIENPMGILTPYHPIYMGYP